MKRSANSSRPPHSPSLSLTSTSGPRVHEVKELLQSKLEGFLPESTVQEVENLVEAHPLWVGGNFQTLNSLLEEYFPKELAVDIAVVLESLKPPPPSRAKRRHIMGEGVPNYQTGHHQRRAGSKQERGNSMKCARVDLALGCPLDQGRADQIWPKDDWDQVLSTWETDGVEKIMGDLIAFIKAEACTLEISFKGNRQSVCGNLKPDVVLHLKGGCATPFSTGVLIYLKSTSKGHYDSDAAVGEASLYGEMLLKEAWPVIRTSIVVGVSDLESIRWFRMNRDSGVGTYKHNPMHPYVIEQSAVTSVVRESICTFLTMDAHDLGIDLAHPIHQLPRETWEVIRFLGSGATSNVYEAKKDGRVLALKVPVNGSNAVADDRYFLEQLEGIGSVPMFVETINTIVCLEPVGKSVFDISSIKPCIDFQDLVDVLCFAHKKGIVQRDVRPENIMIARSLHKKTKKRLFLIDWGFAAPCGVASEFCGGITTASDGVLRQCQMGKMVVYKESDDLVSLVRCTFLLCHPELNERVDECNRKSEALLKFWVGRLQAEGGYWKEAEDIALEGDYGSLTTSLRFVHLQGYLNRTGV